MSWDPISDAAELDALIGAGAVELRSATDAARAARAGVPAVVAGAGWRSAAFAAFRERLDRWAGEVVAFADDLDALAAAVGDTGFDSLLPRRWP